jgi:hypothetical protein
LAPITPASGKYVAVAYELTPSTWGAAAIVSVHTGVEQSTQLAAEEHAPATTAGKIQVKRVIIHNATGVYSIVKQEDVRLWATGGEAAKETAAEGKIGTEVVTNEKVKQGSLKLDRLPVGVVLELLATGTGRKIAFGSGETPASIPGGAWDVVRTVGSVEHKLGVTPRVAMLIASNYTDVSVGSEERVVLPVYGVTSVDSSHINYEGSIAFPQGSRPWQFYWLAIG